jgi:hypothetical protein
MMERSPIPQGREYSEEFRDFLRLCLQQDPWKRPPAEQLLAHPWIRKVRLRLLLPLRLRLRLLACCCGCCCCCRCRCRCCYCHRCGRRCCYCHCCSYNCCLYCCCYSCSGGIPSLAGCPAGWLACRHAEAVCAG